MFNNKIDANQPEIVAALRAAGYQVFLMQQMKKGFPDLLVGGNGAPGLLPMEVKDGSKPPSARKLTVEQIAWHKSAQCPVAIVLDSAGALTAMRAFCAKK